MNTPAPDESLFENACFEATLRTLRLQPTDVLIDDRRSPANSNDPLLRVARPTWIGKNYRPGGVLLLGKNPAGGSVSHRDVSHPSDADLAVALERLVDQRDITSYRLWRDEAQPRAMSTWRIWQTSATAVLGALAALKVTESDIAFGNLVPFRTNDNAVKQAEYARGWKVDLRHVVALIKPRLIVKMTAEFPGLRQVCTDVKMLSFRRANGDMGITPGGATDLAAIRQWAEDRAARG